jgi:hypothetical protein
VIEMSGHPPWPAQVILNGHEYVAVAAQGEGIGFVREGNCFTGIADPRGLARVADALSQHAAIGRLGQACHRWIYTACLCFGLDLDDQARSSGRAGRWRTCLTGYWTGPGPGWTSRCCGPSSG